MLYFLTIWILLGLLIPAGLASWLHTRAAESVERISTRVYGLDRQNAEASVSAFRDLSDPARWRSPVFIILGPVAVAHLLYGHLKHVHLMRSVGKALDRRDEAIRRFNERG